MNFAMWAICAVIFIGFWMVARAIERGFETLSNRLDRQLDELNSISTKLDNLWSPLRGINNKLWGHDADPD